MPLISINPPRQVLETEEARELVKSYTLLVGLLADFENENIEVCIICILNRRRNPFITLFCVSLDLWRLDMDLRSCSRAHNYVFMGVAMPVWLRGFGIVRRP